MITLRAIGKPDVPLQDPDWRPRLDPDGYAAGPFGDCLFFDGCTFVELFPATHWTRETKP